MQFRTSRFRQRAFSGIRNLILGLALAALTACDDPVLSGEVTEIKIIVPTKFLDVGQSTQFAASAFGAGGSQIVGAEIAWSSSNADVARVSEGRVSGHSPGQAFVRATARGVTDSVQIIIEEPVADLLVMPSDTLRLNPRFSREIRVEMRNDQGQPVRHSMLISSSDRSIVSISGLIVSGVAPGAATLRITAGTRSVSVLVIVDESPLYDVTVIGNFGGTGSSARDLNNLGWVVGSAMTAEREWRGFLWKGDGELIPLGPAGRGGNAARVINDDGLVLGWSEDARMWMWKEGIFTPIVHPDIPESGTSRTGIAHIWDLNNRGQAVVEAAAGSRSTSRTRSLVWDNGRFEWLDRLAFAINDRRMLLEGGAFSYEGSYVLDGGERRAIPRPAAEAERWAATNLNDRGDVLGKYQFRSPITGKVLEGVFVWDGAHILDYGAVSEVNAQPVAINSQREIVGYANYRAFLIRGGQILDLTRQSLTTEWTIRFPDDINDRGQILALGEHVVSGERHALLLNPIGR